MSEQKNSLGLDERTSSWFAYLLSIISATMLLVTEKENKAVRTHAWQSLILGCAFIAVSIVLSILMLIPFIWVFFLTLRVLLWVAWFALTIICIVKAAQGEIFRLPIIYDQAEKLA